MAFCVKNTFLDIAKPQDVDDEDVEDCSKHCPVGLKRRSATDTCIDYSFWDSQVARCRPLQTPCEDEEEVNSQGTFCLGPSSSTDMDEDWASVHTDSEPPLLSTGEASSPPSPPRHVYIPAPEPDAVPVWDYAFVLMWPVQVGWTQPGWLPPGADATSVPSQSAAQEEGEVADPAEQVLEAAPEEPPLGQDEACQFTADERAAAERYTTLMLRNLPNDYNSAMLLRWVAAHGIKFRFAYLPIDFRRECSLGYAFLDCETHEDALAAKEKLEGFCDWEVEGSSKVCHVCWGAADFQGVDKNIERYRNSPVMHEDVPDRFKPMLFEQGERVPFSAPTRRIRKPRNKHGRDPRVPAEALAGPAPWACDDPEKLESA